MTENKYESAFHAWIRLGDRIQEGKDVFELHREKAVEFESAFPKAEKWDKLIDALSKGIIDKDDLVDLEYGPEELQTSDEKEVQS